MPMQIIRDDITRVEADAIVNSANRYPTFASGVDERIYEAAGIPELLAAREKIGYLEIGEAGVTPAFKLKAKYIFHVSSPHWQGGRHNEINLLRQCYNKVLALAAEHNCTSIAIPLLATGNFRFPQGVGLEVATAAIREFLHEHEMLITLVVYNRKSFTLAKELTDDVKAYIDENYVKSFSEGQRIDSVRDRLKRRGKFRDDNEPGVMHTIRPHFNLNINVSKNFDLYEAADVLCNEEFIDDTSLEETSDKQKTSDKEELMLSVAANSLDFTSIDGIAERKFITFGEHVQQLMNKKGIAKGSDVYTACNMDKKLWSKVMKPEHNPSKSTVMQICIGLRLNLDEAIDLMQVAGFAFSNSKMQDIIVAYCIKNKKDIYDTDTILFNQTGKTLSNCG
ncbi:MAG: macro domain-containing protein [Phascolarctobacterium sp.]|nr:macro domain-containing protein [Phascolarctobacterium sp.]